MTAPNPIVHSVLLDLDPAEPGLVDDAVASLRSLVALPGVESLAIGPNTSPEGLDDGYGHALVVVFTSAADRDAYLVAPEHLAAVEVLRRCLRRVIVVDIEGA